jgi:hypothetical protein
MTEATRSSTPLRQLEGGHEQRDKQEHDLHRGEAVQQKDKRPHLPEPRLHDQDHHEEGTDELRYCISLGQHCAFLVQCMPPFMINATSQGPQALVRPKREEGDQRRGDGRRAQENSEGKRYSGSRTNPCRAWGWQEGRGAGAAACGGGLAKCDFPSGATDALPALDLAIRRPARGYTSRREGRWRDIPMRGPR